MTIRTISMQSLSTEAARTIADLVLVEAEKSGLNLLVTVIDYRARVLVYISMENAPAPARPISERKAQTALAFKKSTASWKNRMEENPRLHLNLIQNSDFCFIGGGAPIMIDGEIVGAIGVSGGKEDEDAAVVSRVFATLGLEGG